MPVAGRVAMERTRTNPIPLYHRLQHLLRSKIESGEYGHGTRLPSERELAQAYGVSRLTLRQAFAVLERDGLIRREQGHGTFVAADGSKGAGTYATLSGSLQNLIVPEQIARIEFVDSAGLAVPADVAEHLQIPPGSGVQRIRRVFWGSQGPFAHITNYLPVALATNLTRRALETMPLFAVLKRDKGIEIGAAHGTIEAGLADGTVAAALHIDPVSPVLVIKRTVFGMDRRPVSFNVIHAPSGRYRIVIDLADWAALARRRAGRQSPERSRG